MRTRGVAARRQVQHVARRRASHSCRARLAAAGASLAAVLGGGGDRSEEAAAADAGGGVGLGHAEGDHVPGTRGALQRARMRRVEPKVADLTSRGTNSGREAAWLTTPANTRGRNVGELSWLAEITRHCLPRRCRRPSRAGIATPCTRDWRCIARSAGDRLLGLRVETRVDWHATAQGEVLARWAEVRDVQPPQEALALGQVRRADALDFGREACASVVDAFQ
mmetsp:Transcript_149784/g.380772  ORF Transcript_149784/g.380772 Transcript_149784/m.380772 type:complete len:223 (+) Transcript_149784:2666-3334(+)